LLTESFNDAFTGWDHTWANAVRNRQALLTYWNAGGIVQVNMPMNNPKTKGVLRDYNFTNADMIAARTAGTAINANLRQ
jgi:Glycosyl hydrolase family 26